MELVSQDSQEPGQTNGLWAPGYSRRNKVGYMTINRIIRSTLGFHTAVLGKVSLPYTFEFPTALGGWEDGVIWVQVPLPLSAPIPSFKKQNRDFPDGPVVKNLPSNARGVGSIPHEGTKIPYATGQLSPHTTTRETPMHGNKETASHNQDLIQLNK